MIDLAISAPANIVTSDLARRVCLLMWKYVARRVDSNSSLRSPQRRLHQNLLGPEQVPRMRCRRLPSMSTWGVSLFSWKLNSPFNQSFYLGQMHGKPTTTLYEFDATCTNANGRTRNNNFNLGGSTILQIMPLCNRMLSPDNCISNKSVICLFIHLTLLTILWVYYTNGIMSCVSNYFPNLKALFQCSYHTEDLTIWFGLYAA
jgi:hypothetical protein